MSRELSAAELDAQADIDFENLQANGWKTPDAPNADDAAQPEPAKDAASEPASAPAAAPAPAPAPDAQPAQANPANDTVDLEALEAIANGDAPLGADPLQFHAQVPTDYKTARSALLAEKTDAMGKLMDGEIDAAAYAAVETRVMDALEDLSAQRIRAETLLEANAQTAASAQQAAISALIVRAKDEVAYATDPKAQKRFDMELRMQLEDPANAGKPFAHAVNEAHKMVLATLGRTQPAAPNTPPKRDVPAVPVTLSGLPNAGTSGEKTVAQVLSGLTGPDFDKAFDALPKDQQQKYLKQA